MLSIAAIAPLPQLPECLFILSTIYQLVNSATHKIIAGFIAGSCPREGMRCKKQNHRPLVLLCHIIRPLLVAYMPSLWRLNFVDVSLPSARQGTCT
jgi:hypothetical protein